MTATRPTGELVVVGLAGVSASVVFVEPAPIDALLVGLGFFWLVWHRITLPAGAIALGLVYVASSVVSQVVGGVNGSLADAAVIRDIAIEGYLVFVLLVLIVQFGQRPEVLARFVTALVFGAAVLSAVTVALKFTVDLPDFMYRDQFRSRVSGLFKDPNVLGPFLIFPVLLLAVRNEVVRFPFQRLAAVPCAVVLFLTYSRGAYIGLLAAVIVVVALIATRERITHEGAIAALFTLAGLVTVGALSWSATHDLTNVGIDTSRLAYQDYDNDRFATLAASLRYIADHPFGNGLRAFAEAHGSNPHNLLLGKASDAGLIAGLMVVAIPLVALGRALAPNRENPRFAILVAGALAGNMVVSSVIYAHHWRHLFFLLALAFALRGRASVDSTESESVLDIASLDREALARALSAGHTLDIGQDPPVDHRDSGAAHVPREVPS